MRELDDIALDPTDRQAVDAATRILRERFPVREIVLFGSKARGTADADSDIDLLVLTRRELSAAERRALGDAIYHLELERDVLFGTVVVSREDWYHGIYQALPLRAEVDRDGVWL